MKLFGLLIMGLILVFAFTGLQDVRADEADEAYETGLNYITGYDVKQDSQEALKWFRKAADKGNSDAQKSIGMIYERGEGVTQDYAEAMKWYQKAADKGNKHAQYQIGVMYEKGKGVTKDPAEAMKWYQKAADQGEPWAAYYIKLEKIKGVIWSSTKGIPPPEYEIEYTEDFLKLPEVSGGTAIIVKTSTTVDSNISYIREAYHDFVKLGTLSFGIDGVESFSLQYKLKMTDFYGKDSIDDAIIITMPKEDFVKFNWKGLDHKPIDRQLESACSKYYIHPSLLKGVKKEDLWLTY